MRETKKLTFGLSLAVSIVFVWANLCTGAQLGSGKVHSVSFKGPITKKEVKYRIYLPDDYNESDDRYGVIYHLHGLEGDQFSDNEIVVEGLKKAIEEGVVRPMIVVFAYGYDNSMWADSKNGEKPAETNIIKELIGHIDGTYRTIADRHKRIIQGFSMGGYGACSLAVKYPDQFCACINYDGALHNWKSLSTRRKPIAREIFDMDEDYYSEYSPWENAKKNVEAIRENIGFFMVVGALGQFNERYNKHLRDLGIQTDYIQASCEHDLDCITGLQWEPVYSFIAERTGFAEDKQKRWREK